MVSPDEQAGSSSPSVDMLDSAIEALWRGDAAPCNRLLGFDEPSTPNVGELLLELARGQIRPVLGLKCPSSVAGYEVLREIGRGGMGIVYEAVHQETTGHVALKILPGLWTDEYRLGRFRGEVRNQAQLNHPGIAAIHDAGHTPDGLHFFTMELVSGVPLHQYARRHRLPLKKRLELFLKVCDAVTYMHQHGIIHRDLKPSNILVMEDGDPKLLDFGLASIIKSESPLAGGHVEADRAGTLQYMSPEQARGASSANDVRSDVYSLGVICYELLTGQLPYKVDKDLLSQAIQIICEDPPQRPVIVDGSSRGDLEFILLKALRKQQDERYQSVAAMADDVRCYLTYRPISNRPAGLSYRLGKFVQRNRMAAISVAAVLLAVILGFTGATWQAVIATQQRNRALDAEKLATQTKDFLQEMFTLVKPEQGRGHQVTVFEAMRVASARLERKSFHSPSVEADLHETLGQVYDSLECFGDAEPHLRKAVDERRTVREENPENYVATLRNHAAVLSKQEAFPAARDRYEEALAFCQLHWGPDHPETAQTWIGMADWHERQGHYADAESLYRQALDVGRHQQNVSTIVDSLQKLGELHHAEAQNADDPAMRKHHIEIAQSYYEQTQQACRQLANEDATSQAEATALSCLANLLRLGGDLETAQQLHGEALKLRRRNLGEVHPAVARSALNLAVLLREMRENGLPVDDEEIKNLHRQVVAIYSHLYGVDHYQVGWAQAAYGLFLVEKGDLGAAETELRDGVQKCRKSSPNNPATGEVESWLGECLTKLRKFEEAEPLVKKGPCAALESGFGKEHRRTLLAWQRITNLYEAWGKPEMAAAARELQRSGSGCGLP